MNQEPAFSLIVPHRGTPRLLARLLASVPRREDTEIIIVDDCSSPASKQELREAVAACPQARLIELQEHKGAGHARNVALKEARGRWLVFADADDYFTPPMAEVMERYALKRGGGGQNEPLVVKNPQRFNAGGATTPPGHPRPRGY
ncbi:MAG: glycosyltransferase family 2 protein [Prevotellaceae bacterium]|nr:glycosyltransferase family 2 protein [Prevotellaceae bacterium]